MMADLLRLHSLVCDMRAAQRVYFQTRQTDALQQSKSLERQVDEMAEKITKAINGVHQPDLFEGGQ